METNRYYHGHRDRIEGGLSPLPDVTGADMLVYLVKTIQIAHCIRDKLTDYCWTTNQFHTFIQYHCETGQIRSNPSLSTLHRQQEWTWYDGRKFWQVMNGAKSVWKSKQGIFNILQPFCTSGRRLSYYFVQKKGHFLTIHTQETQTFWHQNLQICDETGYTYMTVYSLLDGGEEISYGDYRFILVNDILETMAQIGTQEKHSTKTGMSRTLTVT